jgi:hypothetical protein
VKTIFPAGVLASIPSVRLTKAIPRALTGPAEAVKLPEHDDIESGG